MAARPHSRFQELIALVKEEYDRVSSENHGYMGIRNEFSRRADEQTSEMNAILTEFHDLEQKHLRVKEHFEAEIMRLKGQPAPPLSHTQPPSTAPLPQTTLNPPKRRQDPSSQLPPYTPPIPLSDPPLPTMFSRPIQQQPPGAPSQNRLMSIPSLPSAPTPGMSSTTPPGVRPQPIPGKMLNMPLTQPPNGALQRENPPLHHQMKKDPASHSLQPSMPSGPPQVLGSTTPGNAPYGPHGPHPVVMHTEDAMTQAQTADADDWVVYQGRAANGSLVNMKVSLQHTLQLESVVCCVRYSWDGQYLATGSNHAAHIFDASSGQRVATFAKDTGTQAAAQPQVQTEDGARSDSYVRAVCFSRDGKWLITGAEDHVVKVWDVRNRKVRHKLVGHETDIYSVDASADSRFIISGSGDKKAKLWSLETGKLLNTLGGEFGPTDGITSVSVSPTSRHVAAGSLDKLVRVWDVDSARLVRQFEGHRDSVYSVAFSPDGRLLLSGSLDRTLKLWDLAASQPSSQCTLTFTGHKDFVLSVAFSPNGRWLISGSKDRTVQFWDPRQPTMCLMLQGHKNSVISIAHNPTNKSLATGSGDCRARTWMYSS